MKKIETCEDLCKLTRKLLKLSLKIHEETCKNMVMNFGAIGLSDSINDKDLDKICKIIKDINELKKLSSEVTKTLDFDLDSLDDPFGEASFEPSDLFNDESVESVNSADVKNEETNKEDLKSFIHRYVEKCFEDVYNKRKNINEDPEEIDFSVDIEALKQFFGED